MTTPQNNRPAPPTQLRLGLWGPPGSGKTTYLAALKLATMRRAEGVGNWIMSGLDDESTRFLQESTDQLTHQRTFPRATSTDKSMLFRFTGEREVTRRNRFGRKVVEMEPISFELDVLDVPGGRYDSDRLSQGGEQQKQDLGFGDDEVVETERLHAPAMSPVEQENQLLDHLQMCHGIVYLFDPERDSVEHDAFRYFHPVLDKLTERVMSQVHFNRARLPHHVAVCVTKFDQPNIYRQAQLKGYTLMDGEPPYLPRVPNESAGEFFAMLCADPQSNTDLVEKGLRQYFSTLNYFITSSIGFYVAGNRFRAQDSLNVERVNAGPDGFRIKGRVYPINVLEPLLWLYQSILPARP
ncbi:hypothetical protein [Lentzea sp. NBRC 102530]|uniref:hypothetical protein n=1 Tax=Lentzea sp. NBRC 102530 TaxID=3032201 RepID=UPI0024A5ED2A|nr:hypothetical protein [Lentzea sp. NBRC 102530]GLY50784.1 hypothetical protein Lesp01_44400 [Lentzea sp. NBRC 102530]